MSLTTVSGRQDVPVVPLAQAWQTENPPQKEWSTTSVCFTWKQMQHSSSTNITGLTQTSGGFWGAFSSANQRNPEPAEEKWLCWCSRNKVQYLHPKCGGEKKNRGRDGLWSTATEKSFKRELNTQAQCRNLFFQVRLAEHTRSRLAAP